MLFNSIEFALFFPIVTLLYFLTPHAWRWLVLLIASCIFYMVLIPIYILVLFALIAVDYYSGIFIDRSEGKKRKTILLFSLAANLGILFFFKYFNFFNANFATLANFIHWNYPIQSLAIILPVGLSFHTFQSMAYTIEVYRRRYPAEKHLGIYALYVLFYPQLVAGPIERPQHLLPQFHREHPFDWERIKHGLAVMLGGLFKKMVIADQLAVLVNQVYGHPTEYTGIQLVIATYFFAFQIFCDFSGYTDIARGAAEVMGYKLMINFNRPYFASSVSDFWHKWHISLSTWFRDYLYIPLGGNRVSTSRQYANLMLVFVVSGLWHGASWNFAFWGFLHGSFLILSLALVPWKSQATILFGLDKKPKISRVLSILLVFHLVCFAWIFFRANSLQDAFYIVNHLFNNPNGIHFGALFPTYSNRELWVSAVLIAALIVSQMMERKQSLYVFLQHRPTWLRIVLYGIFLLCLVIFVLTSDLGSQQFIYFQF